MAEFDFRVRFHLLDGDYIGCDAQELLVVEDQEGHRLRLKSGEHSVPIKERSRAALIGGPYPSEEDARDAAAQAKRALLIWAVTERRGIDLGDGKVRGGLTNYGREVLEQQTGRVVRTDVHGVDVYPRQDHQIFISIDVNCNIIKDPTTFIEMVSRRFVEPVALTEKQVVAAELYCSSFFDVSFRSRLITLMSAVEALLDCPERSSAVLDIVDLLDKTVKEANIDEATKAAMRGSLQWLRQDSIGQTGKILSTRLLASREYLGKTAPKFFRYCYNLRSQIVHNGQPSDPTVDLLEIANTFQGFVADLLLASFGVNDAR